MHDAMKVCRQDCWRRGVALPVPPFPEWCQPAAVRCTQAASSMRCSHAQALEELQQQMAMGASDKVRSQMTAATLLLTNHPVQNWYKLLQQCGVVMPRQGVLMPCWFLPAPCLH